MRLLAADVRLARGRRPAAPGASSFATAFTLRVGASADDAIEVISTGAVTLTDAGLNLGKQDTTNYPVLTGARFTSVPIAAGQDVGLARLRFVARSANSPEFVVRIRAQAHDSAPAFTTATSDISGRTLTTAYVDWSVPEWGVNQDDAGTLSPDLSRPIRLYGNLPERAVVGQEFRVQRKALCIIKNFFSNCHDIRPILAVSRHKYVSKLSF